MASANGTGKRHLLAVSGWSVSKERPLVRILHVLGKLDRGGVEAWLVQLLGHIDRSRYEMDFMVHSETPGAYDEEIRNLGAKIIPCLHTNHPLEYARNFGSILREHGPYDCVHSHVHHYSGFVLLLARMYGIPVRIAQSHTGDPEQGAGRARKAYLFAMRKLIISNATAGIVVSDVAGNSLFPAWSDDPRWSLLPIGIDVAKFNRPCDPSKVRSSLGIPPGAKVVGHVGRFVHLKNHSHILNIAKEICPSDPAIHFLLVGDGPLRGQIESDIAAAGLTSRFTLTGLRPDVPQILKGGMDVFVFPSAYEGMPLSLLEAQVAGLHCVASDVITSKADLRPGMITWVPLEGPLSVWTNSVRAALQSHETLDLPEAVLRQLSIESSVRNLTRFYDFNSPPGLAVNRHAFV
jgi:glycosyltransferase involved in cell wall biosynthesis